MKESFDVMVKTERNQLREAKIKISSYCEQDDDDDEQMDPYDDSNVSTVADTYLYRQMNIECNSNKFSACIICLAF